jgi:hypothetical protein
VLDAALCGHGRDAVAEDRLGVAETSLQRLDELVALTLEAGRDLAQALLEVLHARVGDLRKALAEHRVGLAREDRHRAVELAAEPAGGVLTGGLDGCVELLCGRLGEALRLTIDGALQLVDLPALDVGKRALDALDGLRLLPLDLFVQIALAAAESVAHLVQGAAPLGRVALELRARAGDGLLGRPLELGAEPPESGVVLLARGGESLRVGRYPCVGLADQLLLALLERVQLGDEPLLDAVEILAPRSQAVLDPVLGIGQLLAELDDGALFPIGHGGPALLGDAALLGGEERRRLGSRYRQRALQFRRPVCGLALEHLLEAGLRAPVGLLESLVGGKAFALQRHGSIVVLRNAQEEQRDRERHYRGGQGAQGRLGRGEQRLGGDHLGAAVGSLDRARH